MWAPNLKLRPLGKPVGEELLGSLTGHQGVAVWPLIDRAPGSAMLALAGVSGWN